jgi:predicted DNA-binding transcriptional regulator AlpA
MNHLIEKSDPRVADLFRRLEKANSLIDKLEAPSRRSFNGQRFITDRELSEKLRISRRTLQEYRSAGTIPYYLICGKILYAESEIQQFLEDTRKQSIGRQELV